MSTEPVGPESATKTFEQIGHSTSSNEDTVASRGGVEELSPAEFRVVAEVASGSSNREIARVLFLSVRTVESHLGAAYRKLGLRSRTQLAVFMLTLASRSAT